MRSSPQKARIVWLLAIGSLLLNFASQNVVFGHKLAKGPAGLFGTTPAREFALNDTIEIMIPEDLEGFPRKAHKVLLVFWKFDMPLFQHC